jgi:hypothetical protein
MVYVIQFCWQLASRIRTELQFRPDTARKLYDIYRCCVYSEKLLMTDRGTVRNMYSFQFVLILLASCASCHTLTHIHTLSHTHSPYVILIAFPRQEWLRERASILRFYVRCCTATYRPQILSLSRTVPSPTHPLQARPLSYGPILTSLSVLPSLRLWQLDSRWKCNVVQTVDESIQFFTILGLRHNLADNCALLSYYTVSSGNLLPTFRDNLSVQSSSVKNPKHFGFSTLEDWTSARNQLQPKPSTIYRIRRNQIVWILHPWSWVRRFVPKGR